VEVKGTNAGGASGPELLLRPPERGRGPLGSQLERALRDAIRGGRLTPGARVPPSRTLARDLGVSRRLVVGAYEQLVAEGWLQAQVGAGTFVRRVLPASSTSAPARPAATTPRRRPPAAVQGTSGLGPDVRYDFFPGHPDLSAFPRAAWGRATRDALRELPDRALGYGDPRGLPELREALATLLARTRGVVCRPGQIVVCQGAVQALGLLVAALRAEREDGAGPGGGGGRVRVAVEDPYLPEHRVILDGAGADLVPVPVDELGVRDEAVAHADVVAALLTPAHQMPTGVTLAAGRRAALGRWAQASGGLLIEDDYDAEYRYDRAPVAAMQGLAPAHVAYIGSVSKTLAPGLRLAWVVVPEDRLAAVVHAKRIADGGSPVLEQAALTRLIGSGAYDRHVRAARRHQRSRRDALVAATAEWLPGGSVDGIAAGLHAVLRLPAPVDAAALHAAAVERDVRVYPLSWWRADPPPQTTAVVMGYGALAPGAIREGVRRLADAVAAC
jgi:GntR family transcriptional regulator/MocR family aminotransferase